MEWFDYGKHAPYIWSSFALTFAVLLANVIAARLSHRNALRDIRRMREDTSS